MKPNELFNYLKSIKHDEYITAGDDVQYLVRTFHDEKRIRLIFEESCGKTDWKNNFNFPIKPYKNQENVLCSGRFFGLLHLYDFWSITGESETFPYGMC